MGYADTHAQVRDFLIAHREANQTAYRDYRRPRLQPFNWALEFVDAYVRGECEFREEDSPELQ